MKKLIKICLASVGSLLLVQSCASFPVARASLLDSLKNIMGGAGSQESQETQSGTGGMNSWWDEFIGKMLGIGGEAGEGERNAPPPQPMFSTQKNPQSQPRSQSQQSGGAQGGHENGSPKYPYHLEPNQFKKVCGENTYVLWWSQRGSDGKDLDKVEDKMGNNGSYLTIPSCDKLAECHCCCCNQCTHPRSSPCPPGFCFSVNSCCDSETECNTICGPKCDPCNQHCEGYEDPFHTTPFQTDCQCEQKGCPDGKGCKIVLFTVDSGWEWARYDRTKNWALETHVETGKKPVYVDNSKDVVTLKSWGKDPKNPHGWIDRLIQDKGQCCKCVSKQEAEKGPGSQ